MIKQVFENKKQYLSILLLGDEQESMIDKYLEQGVMYVLSLSFEAIAALVALPQKNNVLEIKNIAVLPKHQKKGYGKMLINFVEEKYSHNYELLIVGTGEVPSTLDFYNKCGFSFSHRIKDFYTSNYDSPIYEDGILLTDMVYLKKEIRKSI